MIFPGGANCAATAKYCSNKNLLPRVQLRNADFMLRSKGQEKRGRVAGMSLVKNEGAKQYSAYVLVFSEIENVSSCTHITLVRDTDRVCAISSRNRLL